MTSRSLLALGAGASFALASLPTGLSAHGGVYRGPGDVVPPNTRGHTPRNPNGPGPITGGPAVPGVPRPAGPISGGGAPPPPPSGGPPVPGIRGARTGGIVLQVDLGKWQFWWEFNKDPFLNLRDAIHAPQPVTGSADIYMGATGGIRAHDTSKPSDSDIQQRILPALKRALEMTDKRDIQSSCVVALAKIGRDHATFKILPLFLRNLTRPDQEVRETAALALGIAGLPEAIDPLVQLATDSRTGRKLCDRSEVDVRTRSFACYGLGLLAHANADFDVKRRAFETLSGVLGTGRTLDRNLEVAAIHGISLLNLDADNGSEKSKKLLAEALDALDAFYAKDVNRRGQDVIRCHVPTAIAKLIGRGDGPLQKIYKAKFGAQLVARKKVGNDIYRSCALALGELATPDDAKSSEYLREHFERGRDAQARYFSLLALGRIGGDANRGVLMTILRKGNKALERPWAAIALGVLAFDARAEDRWTTSDDKLLGELLRKQLRDVKNPESRAAFAVALGLCKHREGAEDLLRMLEKYRSQDEIAGYLCIGLALMEYRAARRAIHEVVRKSLRRPALLRQAAVALGKLGDKTVTTTLTQMLQGEESNLAKLSAIASALAFIGDRRTIQPLTKMLFDEELTPLSRAFAAVALGGVADRASMPWSSNISRSINYRGSVETLTQSGTGVLDIL